MSKKKYNYNGVITNEELPTSKKVNRTKIILLSLLVSLGVFFIMQNSKNINLEGNWNATKIVLNGKNLLSSDDITEYLDFGNQYIHIWGNSINISPDEHELKADFKIEKDNQGNNYIIMSSRENSLNGKFHMKLDTTHLGPQQYIVHVRIQGKATSIFFEKEVSVPPWKPPFPKKGAI